GDAKLKNADLLLGGMREFTNAIKATYNLYWVEKFSDSQFIIIFRKFFKKILNTDFFANDIADSKMCSLTEKRFFIYPFISLHSDFDYSDVVRKNNLKSRSKEFFNQSITKMHMLEKVSLFYKR